MPVRQPLIKAFLVALALAVAAPAARADDEPRRVLGSYALDAHSALGFAHGLGFGARLEWVAHRRGFVDGVADSLLVSAGADLFLLNWEGSDAASDVAFAPVGVAQWAFGPFDGWTVFPELGAVAAVASEEVLDEGEQEPRSRTRLQLYPYLGVGARFRLNRLGELSLRMAWPSGVQVGVTF